MINIVSIVVLIGLGALLPSIRRRELKYGTAVDRSQWYLMIALVVFSVVFDIWLGGTKIALRLVYIIIEVVIALTLLVVIAHKKPSQN